MPDVWDLTEREQGDHVLLALKPEECQALLNGGSGYMHSNFEHLNRAKEEIRRSLRDQKGIEL